MEEDDKLDNIVDKLKDKYCLYKFLDTDYITRVSELNNNSRREETMHCNQCDGFHYTCEWYQPLGEQKNG